MKIDLRLLLIVAPFFLNSCSNRPKLKKPKGIQSSDASEAIKAETEVQEQESNKSKAQSPIDDVKSESEENQGGDESYIYKVGLRDFRQLNLTMSKLTGVSTATASVKEDYLSLKGQMPDKNNSYTFTSSHQGGIFKLATSYCHELLEQEPYRSDFFGGVNFTLPADTFFDGTEGAKMSETLISKIWGEFEDLPSPIDTKSELLSLAQSIINGKDLEDRSLTTNVSKALCVSVLSAAPVVFMR